MQRLRDLILEHRSMAKRFQEERDEAVELIRVIPVLDTNWTPADAQAWEARRQALLARIDGKETP